NRQESDERTAVTCYGIDPDPYTCRVAHPDAPGEYCFPPLASLITGAARLMLTLLEYCVSELGGSYAMEDTDSMAIVATNTGGLVPCPGGPYRTKDGRQAVRALSWKQIDKITERFAALSPYDRSAVPGSILKIEEDNFDPKTGRQHQIYCLAISAKRYALFLRDKRGKPHLIYRSRHGLGHLLNPSNADSDDTDWISQAWLNIVCRALDLHSQNLPFHELSAVGRTTVSSPAVMRPFEALNNGKKYSDQIKPFNFLLTCHVRPFGHPIGANPEHFHLIAPYESNPKKWLNRDWIDQYSGKWYHITAAGHHGARKSARVKTYGDILEEYEYHPEAKCANAESIPSGKQTIGLLQRRHVRVERIVYIGKESNSLEEVESGLIHSAENVYTEYTDARRDEWQTIIVPALNKVPLSVLQRESGLSRRTLIDARTGKRRPHPTNQQLLAAIVRTLGLT
ncbi:MAG: hypothetical protein HYX73_05340, partial [Acidobacteria bacterium]|nr:hypothetical protein [Acidobacteriota bacterium]